MSASSDCYACVKKTTICSVHDEAVEDDHLSRCCSTRLSHEQFLNGKDCQCGKSLFEDEDVTFWCVGCEQKKTTEDTPVKICDNCECEYCESCVHENGDGGVLCEECWDAYTDGIPSEPEVSDEESDEEVTAPEDGKCDKCHRNRGPCPAHDFNEPTEGTMFCYFKSEKALLKWKEECETRWGGLINIKVMGDINTSTMKHDYSFSAIAKTVLNQNAFQKAGLEPPEWKYG